MLSEAVHFAVAHQEVMERREQSVNAPIAPTAMPTPSSSTDGCSFGGAGFAHVPEPRLSGFVSRMPKRPTTQIKPPLARLSQQTDTTINPDIKSAKKRKKQSRPYTYMEINNYIRREKIKHLLANTVRTRLITSASNSTNFQRITPREVSIL
ncbi:hypothetical protein [Muribaculum intestinale]|uniref:hypothetical protein n=1 Tax=Muribaculum intestinale TaxID=1796646 RepID=UPI0025A97933|nr:hypothetical protein [Muribaculum intestinale]